jgi:hypothetical protein
MRLGENEERARAELAEHVAQVGHIGLIRQKAVRNDEPRSGAPRVIGEAPRAARRPARGR